MAKLFVQLQIIIIFVFMPTAALALIRPDIGNGDPHFQTVKYEPEQVVELNVTNGYQLSVAFAEGEQIENIAIGDASNWQITPNKQGDHIFIKLVGSGSAQTNLTVVTNSHTYIFMLVPTYIVENDLPFLVTFKYDDTDTQTAKDLSNSEAFPAKKYKTYGDKEIKPILVTDDGIRTFVSFGEHQPIPAAYSIGDDNSEHLLDGKMRGDKYVVDATNNKLIFRLGNKTAYAKRIPPVGRKK